MSVTDDLLANNARYAESFTGPLPLPPSKQIAVLACMDARLDVYRALGLHEGEAHVIRNAGGVVTDDEIRSLAISQRLLGTKEIVLIHHTDCGMLTFTDEELLGAIEQDTGVRPTWRCESFTDLEADVRPSIGAHHGQPVHPGEGQRPGLRLRRRHRPARPRSIDPRGGLPAQSGRPPRRTSCSTMTFRWISFVPSPTIISGASRKYRSTSNSVE